MSENQTTRVVAEEPESFRSWMVEAEERRPSTKNSRVRAEVARDGEWERLFADPRSKSRGGYK